MKKLLAVFVLMLFVSTSFAFAVHEDIGTGEPDNIETVQSITLEQSVLVAIDLQTHTDFIVNDHVVSFKLFKNTIKMKTSSETVGSANQLVSFGKAIKALKQGKRVTREGWNGKGLFIFQQIPSSVPFDIIPKMTSLPDSVKKEFQRRKENNMINSNHLSIKYQNQLAMVYPNNNIFGWVASPSDVLESDWIILD